MSTRRPRAKWVLPAQIDPPTRTCWQIEVPDDPQHRAAFVGALLNLASGTQWADDPLHQAREVALVWQRLIDNMKVCDKPTILAAGGVTLEDEMSQQIQISPDDSCIIQMWCIDHWENWYDPRLCIGEAIGQPAPGGEIPPTGKVCYPVAFSARDQWLLPVAVSTGDKITISDAKGGWNDGTLTWACPSGGVYGLGICGAPLAADLADPYPTLPHMRIIGFDGIDYYDAFDRVIIINPGVTDANFTLQANDSTLADNQGSISLNVCVERSATIITITDNVSNPGPDGGPTFHVGDTVTWPIPVAAPEAFPYDDIQISPCVNVTILSNNLVGASPSGIGKSNCDDTYLGIVASAGYAGPITEVRRLVAQGSPGPAALITFRIDSLA